MDGMIVKRLPGSLADHAYFAKNNRQVGSEKDVKAYVTTGKNQISRCSLKFPEWPGCLRRVLPNKAFS